MFLRDGAVGQRTPVHYGGRSEVRVLLSLQVKPIYYRIVTQMVLEYLADTEEVGGSSPSYPTKILKISEKFCKLKNM